MKGSDLLGMVADKTAIASGIIRSVRKTQTGWKETSLEQLIRILEVQTTVRDGGFRCDFSVAEVTPENAEVSPCCWPLLPAHAVLCP